MPEETTSNAVERALSIIETIAESGRGLSNSDLSRRLKMPKSSASYILRVLEKRAYLHRDPHGKYRLGLKLMSLSGGALTHLDVREVAKPVLQDFLKKSRLPEAHLAVLDNGRAVYIEKVENEKSFIKMDIWVGHRLPVHTTAIGKVLVAHLPDKEIVEILEMRGMEKKTRRSITSKQKFLQEMKRSASTDLRSTTRKIPTAYGASPRRSLTLPARSSPRSERRARSCISTKTNCRRSSNSSAKPPPRFRASSGFTARSKTAKDR
jgi:IclR family KDG regulon transcriptional repressor